MAAIQQPDQLDHLIRRHLTVGGVLHQEAYDVVVRWYTYLNVLANSIGNQATQTMPAVGIAAVESAFETPIIGFVGNTFWQQHGHTILPLICQDMVQHRLLGQFKNQPDLIAAVGIISRYTFIGQVVALVQRDGLTSWTVFETEFRALMMRIWQGRING